jgi:hypothetical protein
MAKSLPAKYRGKRLAAATGGRYVKGVCDEHSCLALPRSAPLRPAPSTTTYRNALHPKVGVFRGVSFMACGIPRSLADAKQTLPDVAILRSTKAIKAENLKFHALKTTKFLVNLPDI